MTSTKIWIGGLCALGFAAGVHMLANAADAPSQTKTTPSTLKMAPLPPLDLRDMRLWNSNGKWMASQWNNASGPIPWRYDRIRKSHGGDTIFKLDADGGPQLQPMKGTPGYTRGLWETDVTLPKLRDGLIVAPLWIYHTESKDEVDFEFAGRKGLDVTMHVYVNGVHMHDGTRLFAGIDMSGQRKRFGIKIDEDAGYVEMYVDGVMMKRWDRKNMSYFITHPMKPWIEMWPTNPKNSGFVSWTGTWKDLAPKETLTMIAHGYGYTAIP